MNMNLFVRLVKVNEESRTVFGRVVQEVPDHAKEIFDYAASKSHFVEWSK